MKLKQVLSILCFLPLLWSCNNEDDIYEIFVSGTWNVGNFYTGGNWDETNDGARAKYTKEEDIKMLNALTINFLDDGTLQGRISNGTFSANWQANADDRSVSITNLKASATPSGKSKELIDALKNATFYKGDSNYLKLASEDKKTYVQLGHYSK